LQDEGYRVNTRVTLDDLRTELQNAQSEIRAIVREEVKRVLLELQAQPQLNPYPNPNGSPNVKASRDSQTGFGRSWQGRVELTEEEEAWARQPDSFCIGKGNVSVLTVTPGLESHIEESEMKERGTLSNLGEVSCLNF
jgi:hypothetical protein